MPSTAHAPQLARAAVKGWMPSSVARGVLQDAQLLVSELVANSVQHSGIAAGAPITISAGRTDGTLWFEVADTGRGPVARRRAQPSSGMGLNMVEAAASRWGTSRGEGTKVWFELALRTG